MLEIRTGTAMALCSRTLQPDEGDIGERKAEKIAKFRGIRKSRRQFARCDQQGLVLASWSDATRLRHGPGRCIGQHGARAERYFAILGVFVADG
jgi:hypothetical protein